MPESVYDLCINCSFLKGKLLNTLANIIKEGKRGGGHRDLELNLIRNAYCDNLAKENPLKQTLQFH